MSKTTQAQPVIHPTAAYSTRQLIELLSLRKTTLRAEKRAGRIRYAVRAGRTWFLGRWVLDWLESGEVQSRATTEG